MIFYFSGTGNSQYVAKQMAQIIDDEVISINQCLQKGKKCTFQNERSIVIVCPTYAWRMPKVVEHWINETFFEGNKDIYFVLTCGGASGNASGYAQKLCKKKGLIFKGLFDIVLPDNYIVMYETPNAEESKQMLDAAKPHIVETGNFIRSTTLSQNIKPALGSKIQSGLINPLFYTFYVHDKGFHVSDACVSCSKCEARCPLSNIKLVKGKPAWQGNCTHCMACIGGCPAGAIEYKKATLNRTRYFIMDEIDH